MKRTITIIAAAICACTYTGCKKDKDTVQPTYGTAQKDMAATTNAAYANNTELAAPAIKYNLTVTPPSLTDMLQWTSGTMMVGLIYFRGNVEAGNAMKAQNFMATADVAVNLIATASATGNTTVLGNLYVPHDKYYGGVAGVVSRAVNQPSGSGTNMALALNGMYIKNGSRVGVQVMMSQPMEFTANLQTPVYYMLGNPQGGPVQYSAALTFDMNHLLAGLSSAALSNAVITNNTIVISESSNQELYQLLMNNVNGTMMVVMDQDTQTPVKSPVQAVGAGR